MSAVIAAVTDGIFDVLSAFTDLTDGLAAYRGNPAIFTSVPIPPDAKPPYVVSAEEVAVVPFDTKTGRGFEITRDIQVFDSAKGTTSKIQELAGLIREKFHRVPFAVQGGTIIIISASGPVVGYNDQFIQGRVVTLRIVITEA